MNGVDSTTDYYEILGADEASSRAEIERLYKHKAVQHHPDRGGSEEDMKALNEAYQVLHDDAARDAYDARRRKPKATAAAVDSSPPARNVGVYGLSLSALLCLAVGLFLLFLVRFQWIWFLWPLAILAVFVIAWGIFMAHAALSAVRSSLAEDHPARRFRLAQEAAFWSAVCAGAYGVYLILDAA
ncbi:MAG TPA: J domain-containing protein [Pyrinomonadaceae bacterium]|jgi:curved DNA-binding protein CbpA